MSNGSFFDPPVAMDVLYLKGFTNHSGDGRAQVTYKGLPKGTYGMAIYLGTYQEGGKNPGPGSPVEERLNAFGWVFDPARAPAELASRLNGTYEAPEE